MNKRHAAAKTPPRPADVKDSPAHMDAPGSTSEICSTRTPHDLIAVEAFYRAEQRGFTPGYELDDWLAAEHSVLERLTNEPTNCGT